MATRSTGARLSATTGSPPASQRSIAITLRWRRSSTGASATCCKMTPLLAMNPPLASSTCIEQIERAAIQQALQKNRYHKTKAAHALGLTFRALRYNLKNLATDCPAPPRRSRSEELLGGKE